MPPPIRAMGRCPARCIWAITIICEMAYMQAVSRWIKTDIKVTGPFPQQLPNSLRISGLGNHAALPQLIEYVLHMAPPSLYKKALCHSAEGDFYSRYHLYLPESGLRRPTTSSGFNAPTRLPIAQMSFRSRLREVFRPTCIPPYTNRQLSALLTAGVLLPFTAYGRIKAHFPAIVSPLFLQGFHQHLSCGLKVRRRRFTADDAGQLLFTP